MACSGVCSATGAVGLKILFGSIILYSLANIANGFVHGLNGYTVCRFLAGIGLAGELGGSITLVSEVLPRTLRGYGTMMVSAVGVLGAVVAAKVGQYFDWRIAYLVGGGLGLLPAFPCVSVCANRTCSKSMSDNGRPTFASQLGLLFQPKRVGRYLLLHPHRPSLLVRYRPRQWLFSPEFGARALGTTGPVTAGNAIACKLYRHPRSGDLLSGGFSQFIRARKTMLLIFITGHVHFGQHLFLLSKPSPEMLYAFIFLIGIAVGYWAVFVTVAAEHFGTNLRGDCRHHRPEFRPGRGYPRHHAL